MNCEKYWSFEPGHNGGDLARHIAECPACAARAKREEALAAGMRALRIEQAHIEAPERVEAGATAAYRAQMVFRRRRSTHKPWMGPVLAWASAAAATIAMAFALLHGWQPVSSKPVPSAAPGQKQAAPAMEYASDTDDDSSYPLDADFIPVPNAAKIGPNEDVNLVRVEVPRSAILALGIAVGGDDASEKVVADVVLGADGMARAVRLVSDGSDLE